jgi:hypothetical protein
MIGNVLFLVNKLVEMSRHFLSRPMPDVISGENPFLILIGQAALILGYAGYYRLYAQRAGRWGRIALRLLCVGRILLAIGYVSFMSGLAEFVPPSILPLQSICPSWCCLGCCC